MKRLLLVLLIGTMMATGCSLLDTEEATPPRNPALVDAIANDLVFRENSLSNDPSRAQCVGNEVYEQIGAVRLGQAGVTVENPNPRVADLTTAEAETLEAIYDDCLGPVALLLEEIQDRDASDTDAANASLASADPEYDLLVDELLEWGFAATTSEAHCMAEITFTVFPAEDVASDRAMTRSEAQTMIDVMDGCTDLNERFVDLFAAPAEGFSRDDARCVVDELGPSGVRLFLLEALMSETEDDPMSPELETQFMASLEHCFNAR